MLPTPVSISDITTTIQELLEGSALLQDVWVTGEVSNMTRASSGHWYFTLKDSKAQLRCVMWRSATSQQAITPQNGDAIMAHGRIGVYEPRGEYQLYTDQVQPVGVGDLYRRFEELKNQLQAEGLFDDERKRPIPMPPRQIGVVTSPEAAAFQDIQNVLRRRYPLVEVILSPTLVQGAEAPPQIVAAIERLNAHTEVDIILVCRGGGSLEDLWAFNDERVARAIAASRIPVISGVGHEIDFTIADFVADMRAPTPSAAAELAVPDSAELRDGLARLTADLTLLARDSITTRQFDLTSAQRTLTYASPENAIRTFRQRIDDWNVRLIQQQRARITLLRERLTSRESALNAANPDAILARGYAIVSRSEDGQRITSHTEATPGTGITITLHDGELKARVEDKESHGNYQRTLF